MANNLKPEIGKPTAAPWNMAGTDVEAKREDGMYLCILKNASLTIPLSEINANICLAAAAPELLEALKRIKDGLCDGAALNEQGLDDMCYIASEAIAKAEGKI